MFLLNGDVSASLNVDVVVVVVVVVRLDGLRFGLSIVGCSPEGSSSSARSGIHATPSNYRAALQSCLLSDFCLRPLRFRFRFGMEWNGREWTSHCELFVSDLNERIRWVGLDWSEERLASRQVESSRVKAEVKG